MLWYILWGGLVYFVAIVLWLSACSLRDWLADRRTTMIDKFGVRRKLIRSPATTEWENYEEAIQFLFELDLAVCRCCRQYIVVEEIGIDYCSKVGRMADVYVLKCGCPTRHRVIMPTLGRWKPPVAIESRE
jgi:hypothetical protein